MRNMMFALLLAGCAELAPALPSAAPKRPAVEDFRDKEPFWIVYKDRLTRCWFDQAKGAPVCMQPPVIRVPAELWTPALGIPAEPPPAKGKKGAEGPVVE